MSSTVQIRIQGRGYTLRSPLPEEQIQKVVRLVEEKLAETAGNQRVDTTNLTLLTLLNLAGQYLQEQEEKAQWEQEYRSRLEKMIDKLEMIEKN